MEVCHTMKKFIVALLQLLPGKTITVTTMETVLGGGECCRFRVTVE